MTSMKPTARMFFHAAVTCYSNEFSGFLFNYHNIVLPNDMKRRCWVRRTEQRITDRVCVLEPGDCNTEFPSETVNQLSNKVIKATWLTLADEEVFHWSKMEGMFPASREEQLQSQQTLHLDWEPCVRSHPKKPHMDWPEAQDSLIASSQISSNILKSKTDFELPRFQNIPDHRQTFCDTNAL